MIAGIYSRKSQADAESVERQIELSKAFIEAKGWTVGPVFSDDGISGAISDRSGLNALMAELARKPRAFDAVVMMNVDRLSRGTIASSLTYQHEIVQSVELWYYQSGTRVLLDTAIQELMACIGAFGARDFRDQIKAKTTAALRMKATQGHATGARTFGYAIVRKGSHAVREVVPGQAAIVGRIFTMCSEGMSDRRIASVLNTEGVPGSVKPKRDAVDKSGRRYSSTPAAWSKNAVARILANELYIGIARHADVKADLPELAIVSPDLWQRVQARRAVTKAAFLRSADGRLQSKPEAGLVGAKYALSGLLRCHVCGSGMKADAPSGKDPIARYRCGLRARAGVSVCSNALGISAAEIEESVRLAVHELLIQDPAAVASLLEERDALLQAEAGATGDAHAAALEQIVKLEVEISNLVNSIARGVDPADIAAALAERRVKVEALKAVPEAPKPFDRAAFFKRFTSIGMVLLPGSAQQLRAALKKLAIDSIAVYPGPDGKGWSFEAPANLEALLEDDSTPSLPVGTLGERGG